MQLIKKQIILIHYIPLEVTKKLGYENVKKSIISKKLKVFNSYDVDLELLTRIISKTIATRSLAQCSSDCATPPVSLNTHNYYKKLHLNVTSLLGCCIKCKIKTTHIYVNAAPHKVHTDKLQSVWNSIYLKPLIPLLWIERYLINLKEKKAE